MVELAYGLYLLIAIGMTIWVTHTLSTNGEVFLVQCFGQNEHSRSPPTIYWSSASIS